MAGGYSRQLLIRLLHRNNLTERSLSRTFSSQLVKGRLYDNQNIFFTRRLVARKCSICRKCHSQSAGSSNVDTENNNVDTNADIGNKRPVGYVDKKQSREQTKAGQNTDLHIPVLKDEVLSYFKGKTGLQLLDMTFGAGGHTNALLDSLPDSHIYTLDRDPLAYKIACELAEQRPGQITPLLGRFTELPALFSAKDISFGTIDGVLFDLGSSSMQFDQSERGFSISMDGPLDMRMDADRLPDQPTAADIVNTLDEVELAKIFKKYGEETRARKFAHAIVEARSAFGRITRTKELSEITQSVCEGAIGMDSLGRYSHPATKIFQALRIFVNNEMNELNNGIQVAHRYLKPGGTCVAISFHSLEDRIVKRHFNTLDINEKSNMSVVQRHRLMNKLAGTKVELDSMVVCKWRRLNKKVIMASESEIEANPRSRSAKLRAAVKLQESPLT